MPQRWIGISAFTRSTTRPRASSPAKATSCLSNAPAAPRAGAGSVGQRVLHPQFTTFTFETDAAGETTHLTVDQAAGRDRSPRVSKALPAEKRAIAMSAETFDRYVGVYTLVPGVTMTVSREARSFSPVTGQGKVEIAPETENTVLRQRVSMRNCVSKRMAKARSRAW